MNAKNILLITLLYAAPVVAQYNCLDTSHHLQERFDSKAEHLVQCSCPCNEFAQLEPHNKCIECAHYHHASRMELIDPNIQGDPDAEKWLAMFDAAKQALDSMLHQKPTR